MNEYDFIQTINTPQLLDEINSSGLAIPDNIGANGTQVQIFYSSPLTSDQQITLSSVVANHIVNVNYVPIAIQSQINTLVGYLNSADTTTANIARAVMIANLAPRLPTTLLYSINSQISSKLGP